MITCRSNLRRIAGLLTLVGMLGACAEGDRPPSGLGFLSAAAVGASQARRDTALAGGALALETPTGWCLEPRSLRTGAQGSFALVAGCREITRNTEFGSAPRGYATVVVGPLSDPMDGSAEGLLREVLGDTAPRLQSEASGLVLAQLPPSEEVAPVWRGALMRDGWPVLITIYSIDGTLAGDRGAQVIREIASGLSSVATSTDAGDVSQ